MSCSLFWFQWLNIAGSELCIEHWVGLYRQLYGLVLHIIGFSSPLILSTVIHHKILNFLTQRKSFHHRSINRRKILATIEKRRRLLLFLIPCMFVIFWLPVNIMNLLNHLNLPLSSCPYYILTFLFCHCWSLLSTSANPLFYTFMG